MLQTLAFRIHFQVIQIILKLRIKQRSINHIRQRKKLIFRNKLTLLVKINHIAHLKQELIQDRAFIRISDKFFREPFFFIIIQNIKQFFDIFITLKIINQFSKLHRPFSHSIRMPSVQSKTPTRYNRKNFNPPYEDFTFQQITDTFNNRTIHKQPPILRIV